MSLLKDFLQGYWLGHPLHPALVHLPTGLFPAALLFDVLMVTGGDPNVFGPCALGAIALGLIGAVAAAPAGVADWWEIKSENPAHGLGLVHMVLNIAVLAVMAGSLGVRWRNGSPWPATAGAIVSNVLGNLMLAASGYLGGRMVFEQGIGVARMSKKKWEKLARAGHARLPVD